MSRSKLRIPEPYRAFAKLAKRAKWKITAAGNGHLKWSPPEGPPVFTAASPGSGASEDRAKLRRAGLTEKEST